MTPPLSRRRFASLPIGSFAVAVALALGLSLLGACQPAPPLGRDVRVWAGPPQSTALDAPALRQAQAQTEPRRPGELAWYEGRNDRVPTVDAGVVGPTRTLVVERRFDRTSIHGRTVRDHVHFTRTERRVTVGWE